MKRHHAKALAALQGVLALACAALVATTYYQMLFAPFSLAEWLQRALLITLTAALVLAVRQLLFYRLPPVYSLCLWVVLLVQIANVSLPQTGIFAYGLENQLPTIQLQTQAQSDATLAPTATPRDDATNAQEVILAYPSGAQQTLAYSQTLAHGVYAVWLLGTALVCLWFWGNYCLFVWRLPRENAPPNAAIQAALTKARQTVLLAQNIPVRFSLSEGPLLLGIMRPVIVLPLRFCGEGQAQIQTGDCYFILIHELAHAKAMDNLWSALAVCALASQWYNPLLWVCFICFKRDIERRCDATVAAITGDKKTYASILLKTLQGGNL